MAALVHLGVPGVTPEGVQRRFAFIMPYMSQGASRAMYLDPTRPAWADGWDSHKTNSYYSLNNKLNQGLAVTLLIIKHFTVILKYFHDLFCIFILEFL